MNNRKKMFLLIFVGAFAAMIVDLMVTEGYSGPGPFIFLAFGVAMTGLFWLSLRRDWPFGFPTFLRHSRVRFLIGSIAIVGGLWLLASTILLVTGSMAGFDLQRNDWFSVALLAASVAITPFVSRYMK